MSVSPWSFMWEKIARIVSMEWVLIKQRSKLYRICLYPNWYLWSTEIFGISEVRNFLGLHGLSQHSKSQHSSSSAPTAWCHCYRPRGSSGTGRPSYASRTLTKPAWACSITERQFFHYLFRIVTPLQWLNGQKMVLKWPRMVLLAIDCNITKTRFVPTEHAQIIKYYCPDLLQGRIQKNEIREAIRYNACL